MAAGEGNEKEVPEITAGDHEICESLLPSTKVIVTKLENRQGMSVRGKTVSVGLGLSGQESEMPG